MKAVLQPWQLLLVILAGWINRRQLAAIEYLLAENRVLMEKLGNPNIERFMRSVKEECLDRMIFFGERAVQTALADFLGHYHAERNHQGLGNRLIEPSEEVGRTTGAVLCRERLGGMLRYYYRKAA
jgi:hypothetical protein